MNRIHWISIKKNPNLTQTSLRPTTLFEVNSSLTFIKVGRERLWRAINDREFMRSRVRILALDHLHCGLKIGNNVGMDRKSTKEVVNDLLKHLNVYSFFKVHICDIYGNKFIIKCVVASSSTFYLEKAERWRRHRKSGTDGSTELWRPPPENFWLKTTAFCNLNFHQLRSLPCHYKHSR